MKKYTNYFAKTLAVAGIVAIILAGCETTDPNDTGDVRDKYLGTWTCAETDVTNSLNTSFPITITKDVNTTDHILLGNFNNLGGSSKPYATVSTNNLLTIPTQNTGGSNIGGSGSYSTATQKITLSYTGNDGSGDITYTATLSK